MCGPTRASSRCPRRWKTSTSRRCTASAPRWPHESGDVRKLAGRAPGCSQAGPHPLGGSADGPVGRGADMTMLRHVAAFEWRYQTRSPVFWVGCLIFFLLTFGSVTSDQIQIGSRGNVHINAPIAILQTLAIMSLFTGFIAVAMVAGVVLRDDETGFAPILRSTRIGKWDYLVGRFVGAVAAAFVVMTMIPLAIQLGVWMPWQDPDKIGPFRPWDYVWVMFAVGLPTLLITSSVYFALATVTRSLMWTYVGAAAMVMLYLVMRGLLRDPRFDTVTSLIDPYGQSALAVTLRY